MKTLLATIQGCDIFCYEDAVSGLEIIDFTADADIDCDGSGGNPFHDPFFQPDTRLHLHDLALHAEVVPYVVVPPIIISRTRGTVLGSSCLLTNNHNGRKCIAVVGDSGPLRKIGEISPAAAFALGLDPNPNHGGTSDHIINYRIYVGQPATVNDVLYALQPAHVRSLV